MKELRKPLETIQRLFLFLGMAAKNLLLILSLGLAFSNTVKAQLFPAGTKLHIAHLTSYVETWHQHYLNTQVTPFIANGNAYTLVIHPGGSQHYALRLVSNKLLAFNGDGKPDQLLFDFEANIGDSLTIQQFHFINTTSEFLGEAKVKIDSITYDYFYTEQHTKDSLKTFLYSGIIEVPLHPNNPFDTNTVPYPFKHSVTEQILTIQTSTINTYLGVNLGFKTASDDHDRLRCVEFADGKRMIMQWWYDLTGDTLACDYAYSVGLPKTPFNAEIAQVTVYPNPSNQFIFVNGYIGQLSIYNTLGQLLVKPFSQEGVAIPIDTLQEGVYLITFPNKQKPLFFHVKR
jgi:hypothetical protein